MKKCKILTALLLAVVLAGCAAGNDAETVLNTTDLEVTVSENTSAEASETVKEEITKAAAEKTEVTSVAAEQTTTAAVTEKDEEVTALEVDDEFTETELETEPTNEEDGVEVYYDQKLGMNFILLNVTPQKVYWNEADGYDVTVGQAMDIALPAVFEDWLSDADEMMIYMGADGWNSIADINVDDCNHLIWTHLPKQP